MLTKREAVEKTIQIWEILAKNPDIDKCGDLVRRYSRLYVHDCPCCQYVYENISKNLKEVPNYVLPAMKRPAMKRPDCLKLCPLIRVWGGGMCEDGGSPYRDWDDLGEYFKEYEVLTYSQINEKRAEAAQEIVDGAREVLKEMDDEGI